MSYKFLFPRNFICVNSYGFLLFLQAISKFSSVLVSFNISSLFRFPKSNCVLLESCTWRLTTFIDPKIINLEDRNVQVCHKYFLTDFFLIPSEIFCGMINIFPKQGYHLLYCIQQPFVIFMPNTFLMPSDTYRKIQQFVLS